MLGLLEAQLPLLTLGVFMEVFTGWVLVTHTGDLDSVPSSWSPSPSVVGIWEMNHGIATTSSLMSQLKNHNRGPGGVV